MEKKHDQDLTPGQRFAVALTTSALALALSACDPMYMTGANGQPVYNNPGPSNNQPAAGQRQYTDREAYDKYFAQGYDYIDAQVLARYWGESSPSQAKLRLGRKMLNWGPQEGRIHLGEARPSVMRGPWYNWPVTYTDGGYSYNDAERLSRYWGGGIDHAKMKMARNLINKNDQWTRAALAAAM